MSAYNPNIPAASNNLSVDQGNIQNNFSQANTIFGLDHYAFNFLASANRGFHQQVTFPVNVSASATGTTGILHTLLGTGICFKNGSNNFPIPFFATQQLTPPSFTAFTSVDLPLLPDIQFVATSGTFQSSFKLGPLIFNFGTAVTNSGGTATISFAASGGQIFPYTGLFETASSYGPNALIHPCATTSVSTTGMVVSSIAPSQPFYFMAIGF